MSKIVNKLHSAKIIAKYLNKADIESLNMLKKSVEENKINVTCTGLYNHGKSTLLNALIKDFEHQTFKTADVRETSANKTVKHGNIHFVDTPGLNANKNDDKRVMDAIKSSDITLFVHNVTTGEFNLKEIEFLDNIKSHWKNPVEFIGRTIFVLSRIDEAISEDDIEYTIVNMKRQIKEIFGSECTMIPVSAIDYTDGMIENENELIEISNVLSLESEIKSLRDKFLVEIRETKIQRLSNKYNDLIRNFSSKVQENKLEISKLSNEKHRVDKAFNTEIKNIEETLKNKTSLLVEIHSSFWSLGPFGMSPEEQKVQDEYNISKNEKINIDIKNYQKDSILLIKNKYDTDIKFVSCGQL